MKRTTLLIIMVGAATFGACKDNANDGPGYDTDPPMCGNGVDEPGEQCDGTDLDGKTCESLGYGTGDLGCTSECKLDYSGCSEPPATASAGADDTAGGDGSDGGPCNPEMIDYSCNGIAYAVYEDTASTDLIMEVFDNSISSGRTVACLGDMIGTSVPAHHHIETLTACGPNSAGVEAMVREQCMKECPTSLTEGSPFRTDFAASGRTWDFREVRCLFGSDLEGVGTDPLDASLINSISLAQALGGSGCGFAAGVEDSPGTPTGQSCGETTCAEIDCSSYEPATYAGSTTDRTVVRSWAETVFAEQLMDSMMLPFCGEGLYAWDSDQPTRAKFEGLGAGELFYEMGFRTNDRLLSVQEYIPPSSGDPDSSDLVGSVYPLTTQAEMLAAIDALDLLEREEHFFLIKFKRGTSSAWQNWVRIVDIID